MSWFGRIFVAINRIFGAGVAMIGAGLVAISIIRWWRFGLDTTVGMFLGAGIGFAAAGYLYLTAPLSKRRARGEKDR
jgi:hypothetical protein